MNRYILILIFLIISIFSKSQIEQIYESDSLESKVVLYIPTATNAQLTNLQAEFANQTQIETAVFIFQSHNCLLIDLATVNNPKFIRYAELVKFVSQFINYKDIHIKTTTAYSEIKAAQDATSFTLK
ncbi:MAG: hypothetical protein JNJ41_00590 [Bacteroidia bacterium]|nr:hypothetical protein [Bacteroidia bacterium]